VKANNLSRESRRQGGSFRYLIWYRILRFLTYHTVSAGNSSPTYRWAIALHTIEVGGILADFR